MEITTWSFADLFIQAVILGWLAVDYLYIRKKGQKLHGSLMTVAFAANTASVLALMLPSFLAETSEVFENLSTTENLLFLGHHALGLVAEFLALFLVLRWSLKGFDTASCRGKNLMRATAISWTASIVLGITLFAVHLD